MDRHEIELKAWDLRSKLFALLQEFQDLRSTAWTDLTGDDAIEVAGDLDSVACKLAEINDSLPHTFIAASAD